MKALRRITTFSYLCMSKDDYCNMRKFVLLLMAFMPLMLTAQDNTWEAPEEEENAQEQVNKDAKYLKGAVPEVDGKVVFSQTIAAPGKSATEIYTIIKQYMEKMLKEKNQINSALVEDDAKAHHLAAKYLEWLVFKRNFISLDQTQFQFVLIADCKDGQADVSISRIRYCYGSDKDMQRYTAEEWISDKEAVNKKNTRLLPLSAKFRRKTIDRKDFLFNKIETLLK